MKFVKKITALFLALTMVMAMGITAFAAESTPTTYTISVDSTDKHTYEIYQIFYGDLKVETTGEGDEQTTTSTLSNVKYGTNAALPSGAKVGDAVPEATLEALTKLTGSDQAKANEIAKLVDFTTDAVGTVTANSEKSGLAAGYYILKDITTDLPEGETLSTYIVKVVTNVKVKGKVGTVKFEKKLKDTNDSTIEAGKYESTNGEEWQDSADYDIGDVIPFKLEGTVASNYADFKTYKFIFHDVEETGLTFQEITSVYVMNGNTKTELASTDYKLTNPATDGDTFDVEILNVKSIAAVQAGSKIVVEYTSKLNDNAVIGSYGNVNKAQLEYSTNPNNEQGGDTDKTEWDNVIVFTYTVIVDKTDSNTAPLKGAAFKLEKEIKGVNGAANTWTTVKEFEAGEDTSFTFKGLDDGNYKLTESKTPAGYNTIDPITFTVTAAHDIEWTTKSRDAVLTNLSATSASATFTVSKTSGKIDGSLSTTVVNKKGSELPETGGMGTTVLYIAGIAMIVAAGIVVIARKRNA